MRDHLQKRVFPPWLLRERASDKEETGWRYSDRAKGERESRREKGISFGGGMGERVGWKNLTMPNRLPWGLCRVTSPLYIPVPLGIAYILLSPSTQCTHDHDHSTVLPLASRVRVACSPMLNTHSEALYTRDPRWTKRDQGRRTNEERMASLRDSGRKKERSDALAARQPTKRLCIDALYTCITNTSTIVAWEHRRRCHRLLLV